MAAVVLILGSQACGMLGTGESQDAADTLTSEMEPAASVTNNKETAPEDTAVQTQAEEATAATTQTSTSEPTKLVATQTPETEPIRISSFGFGQQEQSVGYAFLLENPKPGTAYIDSQYQLAAFDQDGTMVDTESGYSDLLLPGQVLGIGGELYLDEGVIVERIDVQVNAGEAEAVEVLPTFKVDLVTYYPDEYFPSATCVLKNPTGETWTDIQVFAVVFDGDGNISGGGHEWLNFLPANNAAGVEVPLTSGGEVGSVEIYPALSGFSRA